MLINNPMCRFPGTVTDLIADCLAALFSEPVVFSLRGRPPKAVNTYPCYDLTSPKTVLNHSPLSTNNPALKDACTSFADCRIHSVAANFISLLMSLIYGIEQFLLLL